MIDTIRLTVRLHRFEIVGLTVVTAILFGATILLAWGLTNVHVPLGCFGQPDVHGDVGSTDPACRSSLEAFGALNDRFSDRLFAVLGGFPIVAGMLLGVPAVSREIELGTASLPWTLSGRRRRWLLRRILVLVGVLLVLVVPLGVASDALEGARNPLIDPGRSFADEGLRGGVLIARTLAGFAVGLLLGLLIGRQLPSVIVGLVLCFVIVIGSVVAMATWSASVAEYVLPSDARLGDFSISSALQAKDGQIVSLEEAEALAPPAPGSQPGSINSRWIDENYDEVLLVVPGSEYPEDVMVHSGLLSAIAVVTIGAALFLVQRRRIA
jgi:hypothetical protein